MKAWLCYFAGRNKADLIFFSSASLQPGRSSLAPHTSKRAPTLMSEQDDQKVNSFLEDAM